LSAVYTVRKAAPSDARSISEIYVESWRNTYAGLLPDELLIGLDANDRESRWWRHVLANRPGRQSAFVAESNDHGVVGFVSGGAARDRRFEYDGEVYTLYLRDDYHGLGLGKRLFTAMAAQLVETRGSSMIVWVLQGNPARFFYEALGGKRVAHRHGSMGGAPIEEIGFAWEDARSLVSLGRQDRGRSTGQT
jgi:GNAT superfamily N-acetyltransferase